MFGIWCPSGTLSAPKYATGILHVTMTHLSRIWNSTLIHTHSTTAAFREHSNGLEPTGSGLFPNGLERPVSEIMRFDDKQEGKSELFQKHLNTVFVQHKSLRKNNGRLNSEEHLVSAQPFRFVLLRTDFSKWVILLINTSFFLRSFYHFKWIHLMGFLAEQASE